MSSSDEDVPLAARFRKAAPAGSSRGAVVAARPAPGRGRGRSLVSSRGAGRGRGTRGDRPVEDEEPSTSPRGDAPPASVGDERKKASGDREGGVEGAIVPAPGDGKGIADAPVVELAVVIPERVAGSRMLLELVPADPSASEVDFSGDMGVIGRAAAVMLPDGGQSLQLDLKGVIYGTSRIQTPGTLVLLSLGVAEAKVEGLLNEVTQLRELSRDTASIDDAALQKLIGNDDADDGLAQTPLPGAKAQAPDPKTQGPSKTKARGSGATRGKGVRRASKKQRK